VWAGSTDGGVDLTTVEFHVSEATTVVGVNERRAAGLDFWVDGTMGFHRSEGRTLVIAPNGPRLARHDLAAGGFISGLLDPSQAIQDLPPSVAHASGGPIYQDPDTGELVLVYHGETFNDGDDQDYYAFIGMAVSDDDGESFHDLGRIVTSWLDEHDPDRPRPVDVGPGPYVVRDGWFHLYFQDRGIRDTRRELSVARAPLEEVHAAVRERRPPVFLKYSGGRFEEPGLGGRSDELLANGPRRPNWFDAVFVEDLDCFLLVYSHVHDVIDEVVWWNHSVVLSRDGIHWSEPRTLCPEPVPAELLYLTIDVGGPVQRTVTGDGFDLYRVRSTTRFRWDDARLEKLTVTFASGSAVESDAVSAAAGGTS
jgi:hypothetical protein